MDVVYSSSGMIIGILFVGVLISLLISAFKISHTNNVHHRINIEGIDEILLNIGRKEVTFPVLLYGGIWTEVSFLHSMHEVIAQSGTGAACIIDAENKQYTIHKYAVHQNILTRSLLISLEEVRFEKELPFIVLKDRVITDIRTEGSSSCYENVLAELEHASCVREIVQALEKGEW